MVVAAVAAVHLAVSARGSRCQHEGGRHGAWEAACGGGDECGGVEGGDGRISDGGGCQGGGGGGDLAVSTPAQMPKRKILHCWG